MPLDRLLGECIGAPPDKRGCLRGLEAGFNEGRRAFRSRSPIFLGSACSDWRPWLPRLVGRRLGDLLRARSRTSGCDFAKLDFVGDWKDGRPEDCARSRDASPCDAPAAPSGVLLILRRFGGESIVGMKRRRPNSRQPAESHKQRSVCSVCTYDLIPEHRGIFHFLHCIQWSVSQRADTRSGGRGSVLGYHCIALFHCLLQTDNVLLLRLLGG